MHDRSSPAHRTHSDEFLSQVRLISTVEQNPVTSGSSSDAQPLHRAHAHLPILEKGAVKSVTMPTGCRYLFRPVRHGKFQLPFLSFPVPPQTIITITPRSGFHLVGLFTLMNILVRNTGPLFCVCVCVCVYMCFQSDTDPMLFQVYVFSLNESLGGNSEFASLQME